METTGKGTASGKIILMGEHSVVYGEPAIALPFSATEVAVTVEAATENYVESVYFQGAAALVPPPLENIKVLLTALQQRFPTEKGVRLTITSTIPAERGMGSSAAVAVAVTRGYFAYQQVALAEQELLSFVNLSEKIAHGNPSGIDAAATSGPNPLYFIRGAALATFPMNVDAYLVVADTGVKGQTRKAVADVAALHSKNTQEITAEMRCLGELTKAARQAIIVNDASQLGGLMTQAHQILKRLTVSNEQLDHLVDIAVCRQALGAKLTGGGRGGCLISLAGDLTTAQAIAEAQRQAGAVKTWIQGLGVFSK